MLLLKKQLWVTILCVLATLSGAIFIAVNSVWLFDLNIGWLKLDTINFLSAQQLHADYVRMIKFIQFPWIQEFKLHYFISSANGRHHFNDVRRLILLNHLILLVSYPMLIKTLANLKKERLQWLVLIPIKIIGVITLVVASLAAIDFEAVFISFHKLFFKNSDWVFDERTDPVINMLPGTFFAECAVLIGVIFMLQLLIIYWWSKRTSFEKD